MFDTLINTVKGFIPNVLWLVVAVVTGYVVHVIRTQNFNVETLIQGVIVAVTAGITTALWYGAIKNAG